MQNLLQFDLYHVQGSDLVFCQRELLSYKGAVGVQHFCKSKRKTLRCL